ncbi:MAG: hypothetical protein HFE59_09490 [Clostridiales bacterium]|nr:hypothetical protein [Clostridiales bacterium]
MELTFKERISFEETIQMINDVTGSVFDTDSETNTSIYLPELYDYALGLSYVKYYGGYIPDNSSDNDYNIAINYLEEIKNTSNPQLISVKNAINEKIELKKAEIANSNINIVSRFDELAKPVIELLDTISEKVNKIDAEKLNKQLNKFNVKNLVDHYFNKRRFDEKMADKDDVKNNNTL